MHADVLCRRLGQRRSAQHQWLTNPIGLTRCALGETHRDQLRCPISVPVGMWVQAFTRSQAQRPPSLHSIPWPLPRQFPPSREEISLVALRSLDLDFCTHLLLCMHLFTSLSLLTDCYVRKGRENYFLSLYLQYIAHNETKHWMNDWVNIAH